MLFSKRIAFALIELLVLAGLSVGLFRYCAELYTRHNTFPVWFHPDEPGKATQIISGTRNHNHPQLMLETCLWLIRRQSLNPGELSMQQVAEIGRTGSALLAAAGAVLIAWAGYFAAGRLGFLLAGVGAGLCPALLSHAHYFKEDASLLFGVAAVLCAGAAIAKRRHWTLLLLLSALLGVACGLAASGKYAGAVMLAPSVVLVIVVSARRWWLMPLCLAMLAGGAVGTWRTVNHIALQQWEEFQEGLERERLHSIEGHFPVSLAKPNRYFLDAAWGEAMPHVKVLAIAAPFALLLTRRRARRLLPRKRKRSASEDLVELSTARRVVRFLFTPPAPRAFPDPPMLFGFWLMLCLICYAIALSYNTIPFFRYALPLTLMLYTLAALSVVWIARCLETRFTPAWAFALIGLALIGWQQKLRCDDYLNQFANDSRNQLATWINQNLRNARIATDGYAELEGRQGWGRRGSGRKNEVNASVLSSRWAAEFGPVHLMRRRYDVDYVVIVGTSSDRFIEPHTLGIAGGEEQFDRHAQFYRTLFEKYPIIKQWKAQHPMRVFMNPDIYVFQLSSAASGGQSGDPVSEPPRRRWGVRPGNR